MKGYVHIGVLVMEAHINSYVHVVSELPGTLQWDF